MSGTPWPTYFFIFCPTPRLRIRLYANLSLGVTFGFLSEVQSTLDDAYELS